MSDPTTAPSVVNSSRPQFGLGAIFGTIFALGLYFAYLRQIDAAAVLYGCLAILMGLAVGSASGLATGHFVDGAYWASLCSALGYVATAGETTLGTEFRLAWAGVGTAAGAGANLVGRNRPFLRVFFAGLGAALVMGAYLGIVHGTVFANRFDAVCAPIVGALIGVLIEILQFVEADRRLPRYTIATWLLCAVLAGNLAVAHLLR
jgi:hypothetical protein